MAKDAKKTDEKRKNAKKSLRESCKELILKTETFQTRAYMGGKGKEAEFLHETRKQLNSLLLELEKDPAQTSITDAKP